MRMSCSGWKVATMRASSLPMEPPAPVMRTRLPVRALVTLAIEAIGRAADEFGDVNIGRARAQCGGWRQREKILDRRDEALGD
jgi:hypothetical protein